MSSPPNIQFFARWGTRGSSDGQFSNVGVPGPRGIVVGASGDVYVADTGNDRVQRFTGSGEFISSWGSEGSGEGQFGFPVGIAVDASGNVYVADVGNGRVQVFSPTGVFLREVLPSLEPWLVAVHASGNLYVWGQAFNGSVLNQVQVFSPIGEFLSQWSAPLAGSIAVDGSGDVYLTDRQSGQVQVFSSDGQLLRQWDSLLTEPRGVAVDQSGNVYVTGGAEVQVFSANGVFLAKWGSFGSGDGQFLDPQGIAVDALGNVYVMDTRNQRVQVFRVELP